MFKRKALAKNAWELEFNLYHHKNTYMQSSVNK